MNLYLDFYKRKMQEKFDEYQRSIDCDDLKGAEISMHEYLEYEKVVKRMDDDA